MSVDPKTLTDFKGKKVILHKKQDDGTIEELEGKVEEASPIGVAFKTKGKSGLDLLSPDQIEELSLAPTSPKKLRQKKLGLATADTVRSHLVDRHGMPLSKANEATDEQALDLHSRIDHSDLGHKHEAKTEAESGEREQAIASAEQQGEQPAA